jgi:hypothetical protein
MKGTLFSADFVKDSTGNLRLLELNTDTGFWSSSLSQLDFTEFFSVLSSNNINSLEVIYKPFQSRLVNFLSQSIQLQPNITSFVTYEEEISTIYPTNIEDSETKFILRMAYDESAIFDSTYCKSSFELHKLFIDTSETGSIPSMYISSSEFFYDGLQRVVNSENIPDITIKDETYARYPLSFYKLQTQDGVSLENSFDSFISQSYIESNILMNYEDTDGNTHKSIRTFNIIYGSELNVINLVTVEPNAIFQKPESLSFIDESKLSSKHYYEFTTNFPKYVTDNSWGGIFEEELISDSDGNPVQISDVEIGGSYKSFYIEGTPDTDSVVVFTSWSYPGQTLPSGSYVTSSVLINKIEQSLPNNLVSHLYYGSGSFRANGGQHILIYDSVSDLIRYEEVASIIPGEHKVFKLDGNLIDITDNDFEVLNEEGFSTYILDLEETDTFALYDNDINIKIVTHNCFPAGTRILLNDGTYKNIEDLTTSDILLTYNNEQGKYGAGTASSIRVSTQNELIYIVTENGDEVKSTPLHKFYVEEHGWSHAQDIKVGNLLFNKDGILVKVKSIESLKGEFKVYHLIDVKDNHTYFAENILVHNKVPTTTAGCFTAETKVKMEDGNFKNIIDIEIGDYVLSYKDGKYVRGVVTDKLIHPTNDVVEVVKYKGMISDRLHPFYDNGKWKPICEASGVELGIQYVDNWYNLEIDGDVLFESEHNYIIEDFIVSGLGDNELLNTTFKRQAVFQ